MAKISTKNMAEAIYSATEGKSGGELEQTLKRGVQVLRNKRMLWKSDEVIQALQNIFDKKTGTIRMKVTTAGKIGNEEKKRIEKETKKKYKAQSVASEFFEKAELLGGMRIEVGNEVLDATYKSKLRKLENFLMREK